MFLKFWNSAPLWEGEGAGGGAPSLLGGVPAGESPAAPPAPAAPAAPPADQPWHAALPENIRGESRLHQFKDVASLAQGYLSAAGLVGRDPARLVELPENAEGRTALMRKLGLPEKVEDYGLADVKDTGDFGSVKGDVAKGFAAAAHAAGVLPEQAQALFDWYANMAHGGQKALREQAGVQATAQIEAIKTELGAAFNERVASASAAAKHFGLTDALNEAGLGTHPGVIKALAALGATLKEGEGGAPRGGQGGSKLTPVEARAKANSLMQRSQELRGKGNAAEADRLHKEAGDYFRMAHGA